MKKNNFEKHIEEMYGQDRLYGKADQVRIAKVVELVGKKKKILDIGCYNGFLSKIFLDNGNAVYGIDIAKDALRKAEKLGIKTKYADLKKKIPFGTNSFDTIVAAEVIEHLSDTDLFLDEVYRVLKVDGFFVLTTSNFVSLGRRAMYLVGKSGYHEASFSYPAGAAGHLRYYNWDLLKGLLERHGFEIIVFTSDVVNFSPDISSWLRSTRLAEICPTLGRSLIVKAKKTKSDEK